MAGTIRDGGGQKSPELAPGWCGTASTELDYRLIDALTESVVVANLSGQIVHVNPAAAQLLGWSAEALAGRPLTTIMPQRMHAAHRAAFDLYVATGVARIMGRPVRVPALHRDGFEIEVELILSAVGSYIVAALRDLRVRIELERKLSVARHLRATAEAAARMSARLDAGHVAEVAAATAVQGFDAVLSGVWLCADGEASLELRASAGTPLQPARGPQGYRDLARDSRMVREVARTRVALVRNGLAGDPRFDPAWVAREGIVAAAIVPLEVAGELQGVVACYFRAELYPELEDVLRIFLAVVAASLNDARLFAREAAARASAEAGELRLRTTLKSVGDAVVTTDATGGVTMMNPLAETLSGYTEAEAVGRPLEAVLPLASEAGRPAGASPVARVLRGEGVVGPQEHSTRAVRDGVERFIEDSAAPIRGPGGELLGVVMVYRDVTERRRIQRQRSFLFEAGEELARSLDLEVTLTQVAKLVVPEFADWCAVALAGVGGSIHHVAIVHEDPERVEFVKALLRRYPLQPSLERWAPAVLRSGRSELYPVITPGLLEVLAHDAAHLEAIRSLGLCSGMVVPMVAQGRVLGAITMVSATPGRRYGESDLALAEDLGRRAALAVENARLYCEAEEAVRQRDRFLAMASHELRTPLTPLHLVAQTVLRATQRAPEGALPSPWVAQRVEVIERQIGRLTTLVEGLLDVVRTGAAGMELAREEFDLAALIREVVAQMAMEFEAHRCAVVVDASAPVWGRWDRLRLAEVASRLLSNAARYGAGGVVEVSVRGDATHAELRVRDHGIGIAREDQARIFGRFERAVSDRHHGGLGIGLWLVREIVEALGGTVRVESAPGEGACFVVRLPREMVLEAVVVQAGTVGR